MLQANELLYGILKTLGKIEENTRGKGAGGAGKTGIGEKAKDKLQVLSNLGPALLSFGKVKPKTLKNFFYFVDQFVAISNKQKRGGKNIKSLAESLSILSQTLPNLSQGLDALGRIKQRQVSRALMILETSLVYFILLMKMFIPML